MRKDRIEKREGDCERGKEGKQSKGGQKEELLPVGEEAETIETGGSGHDLGAKKDTKNQDGY